MTLNNNTKTSIFRPWDEDHVRDGETSADEELRVDTNSNLKINYLRINVKCERGGEDDDRVSGSVSNSSSTSSSSSINVNDELADEEDSLHKLSSLVEKTILRLPSTENSNSVDSVSSCSDASFSASSPVDVDVDINSPRSAFVPTRINGHSSSSYVFPPVSYSHRLNHQHFDTTGAGLIPQELFSCRQEQHPAYDHFAVQQGQIALEEAARLLQHHEAMVKQNKKLRPKKFRCPHCDVAFSNNGQLKGHIRIHTGERPFKCDEEGCGKTFTRNEELTRHKRIHSGVRPHACQSCGKRFGRKDHLKKHARTHEMRGPAIYIPAPGPFPFPSAHPPLHPFIFSL